MDGMKNVSVVEMLVWCPALGESCDDSVGSVDSVVVVVVENSFDWWICVVSEVNVVPIFIRLTNSPILLNCFHFLKQGSTLRDSTSTFARTASNSGLMCELLLKEKARKPYTVRDTTICDICCQIW